MHHRVAAALLALLLLVGPLSSARAEELRINTRDGLRTAIVLPARTARAPTVIVLHGALISAAYTARWSGFAQAAAKHGFAAAFPQGFYLQWNDGREHWLSGVDDVHFLKQLAGALVSRGIADPERLYIAGISNGGMMAFRMLCEASQLFAGAGTVIANMPSVVGQTCRLRRPVPVVMLNGTADPLVPYGGGGLGLGGWSGSVWSAERTAAFLARRNGCEPPSKQRVGAGSRADRTRLTRLDWLHCRSGQNVTLYRVEGGGHQVFGHTNFIPVFFGPGTTRVSAPDAIMAAFAKERP